MISDEDITNNYYYFKKSLTNALAQQNNDKCFVSMQVGLNLLKKLEEHLKLSTKDFSNEKIQNKKLLSEINLNAPIEYNSKCVKNNIFINEPTNKFKFNDKFDNNSVNSNENFDYFKDNK